MRLRKTKSTATVVDFEENRKDQLRGLSSLDEYRKIGKWEYLRGYG
jgi:hypothetical protein